MAITKIETVTVGAGGAASIDFTSIPGTYTDLMVQLSIRATPSTAAQSANIKFNGSTSAYGARRLLGTGSSALSDTGSSGYEIALVNSGTSTANTFTSIVINIPNYAGSTTKAFSIDGVSENNATTSYQGLYAQLWSGTSAISSMTIYPDSGNWAQYSSASLYGITKGSSGGVTVS